ncbi:MAG TPA: amylo-alpha-1,6-glucosidase [Prolixibacteraceae bacterium]|nr:amylo-alpha-1,6-glucosidase [Prolixibacteraceae bacterium]
MSYLKFDKAQLTNLERSLSREIIRSNRAGSYISTTISGCNTRKYHGLLVCPIEAFKGEKHVLLSSLDETVIQHDAAFNLGIHRYQGGHYEPRGHKYIESFEVDKVSKTTYRVGGVILSKERLLVEKEPQVLIRYTLEEAHSPTLLRFRPFLAFRGIHQLSKANLFANTKYEAVANGIRMRLYDGYPHLYMQFSKEVDFVPVPDWYYNLEYLKEKHRGYEFLEDLFVPGYFELPVEKGESIVFAAGIVEANPVALKQRFTRGMNKIFGNESFWGALQNAASQFIQHKNHETDIIAGFPWYGSLTRQTFVALPGLSVALGDTALAFEVLKTYLPHLKKGLFPRSIADEKPVYDTADASLWFFWTLQELMKQGHGADEMWAHFGGAMKEILESYRKGLPAVAITDQGLLYAGADRKALTWMDSYVNGDPVVQRRGMAVEVNALWYNAVCFALELAKQAGEKEFVSRWRKWPARIAEAFLERFWSSPRGYLADVVTTLYTDWSVRPNMVIAASLDYTPLTKEQQKSILSIAKQQLLTPRGLRTLSPDHSDYHGTLEGSPEEREKAVHQGTVWPWLTQFFVRGYLRIHKKGGLTFVKKILEGFEEEINEHCIGTISETYNGNPPHQAKGAISQAWSVAALVYVHQMISQCESQ